MKPINSCPVPKGILLAIGGHENKGEAPETELQKESSNRMEILKTFIELMGQNKPVIEIITTASDQGNELFKDYKSAFAELGIETINHLHHDKRIEVLKNETRFERIKAANGVFFSGGDQLKLTTIYGGTEFLHQLKQRYIHDKVVIAGTSAGAMSLSTPMIYAGNKEVQDIGGEIKITTGLEFLKDVCIDTHFTDRARFVRMAQVIATNPTCIGVGIAEDTGLVVKNGVNAKVVGSGIVIVIDGFHISDSNIMEFGDKVPVAIRDLKVHLLKRDDEYEIPQSNPPHI